MISINDSTKKLWTVLLYLVVVSALFITIYYVASNPSDLFSISSGETSRQEQIKDVSLRIIGPTWTIEYLGITTSNTTVAALLFECAEYHEIPIEKYYWEGYQSYLIESINNTPNGKDGKYWQFYINDQYADVGCSNYFLDDGDTVEWRFISSHWQEDE